MGRKKCLAEKVTDIPRASLIAFLPLLQRCLLTQTSFSRCEGSETTSILSVVFSFQFLKMWTFSLRHSLPIFFSEIQDSHRAHLPQNCEVWPTVPGAAYWSQSQWLSQNRRSYNLKVKDQALTILVNMLWQAPRGESCLYDTVPYVFFRKTLSYFLGPMSISRSSKSLYPPCSWIL